MTHTYNITGMTCGGCKASVEKYLGNVNNVTNVSVNLEKAEVEVTMSSHVATETLKKALSEKYTLSEKENRNVFQMTSQSIDKTEQKSKLQQLQPLFLILFYITTTSILLHYKNWDGNAVMLDLKNFPESFRMYDPLAKRVSVYGWIYPFIETALGLMFLMRFEIEIALIATLIVLSITTVGVTKTLLDKKSIRCACLGTALKLPMTEATFIENAIMIVMAIVMLTQII